MSKTKMNKKYIVFKNLMAVITTVTFFIYAVFRDELRSSGNMKIFIALMLFVAFMGFLSIVLYLYEKKKKKMKISPS